MEPINVIQYKYHDAEFGKLVSEAFKDFTKGEDKITVYTKDKPVTLQREPLLIFSPVLRSVLDSLSCCAKPAISLPDCSSSAVQQLWRIVMEGATDFEGQLNMSEIIVAAKCFQIDVTNFEYVKREVVKEINKSSPLNGETDLAGAGAESDSDLDENEVDDYGEEDDLEKSMETEVYSSETKYKKEMESSLKLKNHMQNLLDDDDNEDQETLEEKAEDRLHSMTAKSDQPVSHGKSNVTDKKPKFRIPKKSDQVIMTPEVPVPAQVSVPATLETDMYNTGFQEYVTRPQIPPQPYQNHFQPQMPPQLPSQNWAPALPVSNQPPFRHSNPPPNRLRHPVRLPTQRAQSQPRYPTQPSQYNLNQSGVPTSRPQTAWMTGQALQPTERPQQQGLWAQSAKQTHSPIPTPVPVQMPRALPSQDVSMASAGGLPCQMCQKLNPSLAMLWQHYARVHFMAQLKSDFSAMANIAGKSCNDCGSQFKSVDALFLHIGTVHRKVNEIMEKRGLVSLEMPNNRARKSL